MANCATCATPVCCRCSLWRRSGSRKWVRALRAFCCAAYDEGEVICGRLPYQPGSYTGGVICYPFLQALSALDREVDWFEVIERAEQNRRAVRLVSHASAKLE